MRITHLGHSCLLVEAADQRILIDPGSFSAGFESLTELDAILITHAHADHVDAGRLPALLDANPQARLLTEPQTANMLVDKDLPAQALTGGEVEHVGPVALTPVGREHAFNHDGVPRIGNLGLVLRADGEPVLFHPGDAYDAEPGDVDVLAVPLSAPWAAVRDTIGFVRRISPTSIVPIHDALLSTVGRRMYLDHVGTHGGEALTVRDLAGGKPGQF